MSKAQPEFHYKSYLTIQKIQDYKSRPLGQIDYEKVEDFEKKFQQFSEKFQKKYFPETVTSTKNESKQKLQRKKTINQRFASMESLATVAGNSQSQLPQNINGILKTQTFSRPPVKQSTVLFDEAQLTQTSTINATNHHSKNNQPLNGLIDQKFKLMLQKNSQKETSNPVVQLFGNQLIATVFQSLIIKTLEEKFHIKINMECDIPISTNVLKMFDLSTVVINNTKGLDNKLKYIYSTMCKKIDSMLDVFEDKQHQKEQIILNQEEKNKKNIKQASSDHFSWLKLRASQDTLKKKLRETIVEKINEYENLLMIQNAIQQKQALKDVGKIDESNKTFCNLNDVKSTSTKEVFKNMSTFGNHKIKLYLSRLGISKYPEDSHPTSIINKQINKRSISEDQILLSPNGKKKDTHHKRNESLKSPGVKGQPEQVDPEKYWNEEKEEEFQKQRSQKKYIYSNEVVSSNWNDVGFLPFVQRYLLEYKKSIHRDTLLDRYTSGEWLTEGELKFLSNTSELLNSCVDKQFMQKAVNIINPDLIDNMELGLAETILCNYEDAKFAIKKARQNFIKEKQQQQKEWLKEQYDKAINFRKKIQNANFYRRYYRIFTVLLDKMEKEQKFADKLPENIHGAEFLNDYLLGKASEKDTIQKIYKIGRLSEFEFKNYLEKKKQQQEEQMEEDIQFKRFKKLSKPISYTNDDFIKNLKRRQYHPSSKLFVKKEDDSSDDELRRDLTIEQSENIRYHKAKKQKIQNQEIEKYELNLKTVDLLKEKDNFKSFYSGGPQKAQSQYSIYERYRITGKHMATEKEMSSIIILQKRFRAFLKRKHLVQQIRNNQIKKDYQYKNIIDSIQMNPNQIHLSFKDSFNPIKPSIDDIQLMISRKKHSQQIRQSFIRMMSRSNSVTSTKGIDRSYTFMSNKHTRHPSFNGVVSPNHTQHQDENKSPVHGKIAPIIEKVSNNQDNHPSTPVHTNMSPSHDQSRNQSGQRGRKFIQLNQGNSHYIPQLAKMKEDMAEVHKRVIAQSASPNQFNRGGQSEMSVTHYGNEIRSTQFSTTKKGDQTSFNQSTQLHDGHRDIKNLTIDLYHSKQSMGLSDDENNDDESGDKCEAEVSKKINTRSSPAAKINQQTYSNNLYQQKRTSLLFKIPSSAVKINKYIDTKNVMQQFALKEILMPKTPKENQLFHSKSLQQKHQNSKIQEAFNKRPSGFNLNSNNDFSISQLPTNVNTATPSAQISQFIFQTPSSAQQSKQMNERTHGQFSLHLNKQVDNILPSTPLETSDLGSDDSITREAATNLPINIPEQKDLDPPQIIDLPTVKQQRLLAAADSNKLTLITNSGFIFYEHDINARDRYGNTALHIATKNGHTQFIAWLISKKANPNLRNKLGQTPLHLAFASNKLDGIMMITAAGGDLNILNKKGETPLALGNHKLLSTLGLEKGVTIKYDETDSGTNYYLRSFNNNTLLERRHKGNEFLPSNADFKMNKLNNHLQDIVVNKQINSFV